MSIFVIDEHPLMREAIAALIRRLGPALTVVELASVSAVEAAVLTHGKPRLVSVDQPQHDGLQAVGITQLKQQFPDASIVVLTQDAADKHKNLALQAGADAYLHKSASTADISSTFQNFLKSLLGNIQDDAGVDISPDEPPAKLSKRQKQLLVLLDKGLSNRDIAEMLQISEHTVKVHLWRLFRRLNVKSRSQAGHMARTKGWISA